MDIRGRARHLVAGALVPEFGGRGQLGLDHVRQFEIVEEVIHELFARQLEDEIVFADLIAIAGLPFARAGAAARPLDAVALQVFLIAGADGFPDATVRVAKIRFVDVLDRNRDFFAVLDVGNGTSLYRARHRILDLTFVAP